MLTLYQVEWCPSCHVVRQAMTELGLTYLTVNVPADREERHELLAVTGQASVPALQDGERVVLGSDEIVRHLRATFPAPDDAASHAAAGRYRITAASPLAPPAVVARLKELLEHDGLAVSAEIDGARISPGLEGDYTLLLVDLPGAAAKAFSIDPTLPAAVALPVAVYATEEGSAVAAADPVGQVWLYGNAALNELQRFVRSRIEAVIARL